MGNCINSDCLNRKKDNLKPRSNLAPQKAPQPVSSHPRNLMVENIQSNTEQAASSLLIQQASNIIRHENPHQNPRNNFESQRRQSQLRDENNESEDMEENAVDLRMMIQFLNRDHQEAQNLLLLLGLLQLLQGEEPQHFSEEDIKKIKAMKVEHDRKDNCAVCQDRILKNEIMSILSCKHQFHNQCLKPWLEKSVNCPICRRKIQIPDSDISSD